MNNTDSKYAQISGTYLQEPNGLLNDNIQYTLRVLIETFVKTAICVIGMETNIINIIVFIQTGLRDSVTVAFFGLAFADFGFVFFTLVYQLIVSVDLMAKLTTEIYLTDVANFINVFAFMCIDISTLITVFTSLQKCACVAIPFLFKNIFTYYLSTVVIPTMYVVVMLYYIPLLYSFILVPRFDRATNRTRYSFPLTPLRDQMTKMSGILNRVIISFSAIILLTASLIIMNRKLLEASRIRYAMTNRSTLTVGNTVQEKSYLSAHELRVIEAVVIISALFVACNLPDMIIFLTSLMIPGFSNTGIYMQTYGLVQTLQNVLAAINSTATIFVYVKYNSKYRAGFLILFGCYRCQPDRN